MSLDRDRYWLYGDRMAESKQVNVKLDDEDFAALSRCAELDKLSQSDVIRRAIRAYRLHLENINNARRATTVS